MKLTYLNNSSLLFSISVLLVGLIFCGCPSNNSNLGADNEEFIGTYMVRDSLDTEDQIFSDSIYFLVIRGTTYSIEFMNATNAQYDNGNKLCDHNGTIFDFGTGKASFVPTGIQYQNCDTASIPRGTFTADFINYADTILLYRRATGKSNTGKAYDSVYVIKLIK